MDALDQGRTTGTVDVSKTEKSAGEIVNEEITQAPVHFPVPRGNGPMGAVTIRYGQTINTGNYNSVKVEVGVTMPFQATAYAFGQAKEWAESICSEHLTDEVGKIKAALNARKS